MTRFRLIIGSAMGAALCATSVFAQDSAPEDLLPPEPARVTEPLPDYTRDAPQPAAQPSVEESFDDIRMSSGEVVQQLPVLEREWTLAQAEKLLAFIPTVADEGLVPGDYRAEALAAAIAQGRGPALDAVASEIFIWLVEDLRDGRTPMDARRQWFVVDPDPDVLPSHRLLETAVETGDIAGTLRALNPVSPDYARLKEELARTSDPAKRKLIRANMDRWRWLARDLGKQYLLANVPEYQLRLTVNDKIIKHYRVVVGKPGRTATPQLSEMVEAVIFNPTWTVPQSIVKGEGLGAKVLNNPGWARANNYTATKGANGWITVVQQPGPGNSLGLMKLDMPNPHAIFFHDTPAKSLFARDVRALSHGCIRVQGARELAMTMAMLGNAESREDLPAIQQEVSEITASGKYTRYPMEKQWPAYITYFTYGVDVNGELRQFDDIYGRDAPVLAALDAPRQDDRARETSEEAVEIVDDLQTS
ncbi:MAG TPA: L,D-transpeptidase [Erythrobacter sp.]|jgi:murein L,D-transpeptidase YcbB/YkuD|uniref:L,D-transpeptidase family protein n=1 Tax=Qipengyuania citrea TaxID=225971 RepID=A0A6I4UBL8_9SPHN|nr:L,D-transpeptidase family protein [Qipengyuania citrea]MAQ29182.1 L,D-transpeptidase [Erythrobacter sp.]MBB12122.1 L,D-transpeptidase [Sphingomonadaceae bacterium]MBN90847.1 L,D-transpeptidase [Erythrobacteraceae bacterium]MCZ4264533.1 L,D-transpeptidase family protein [Erythrobacter sp. G21629-S1]MDQ0566218.1 murein L,D-transpeptidase YcbB/YkuD [Qipengyuania citrea]|tara:strand:- start:2602 stop:4029 length:1428 start_codon:yes stop_codon:yes gene_type:complete